MHPFGALLPRECTFFMNHSFRFGYYAAAYRVPSYVQWLSGQDLAPTYAWHRRFLQVLQWRSPRRRWVLKMPGYIDQAGYVLRFYPDAKLLHTHRDPLRVIASMTSFVGTIMWMRSDEVMDPTAFAWAMSREFGARLERVKDLLARGIFHRRNYCDVPYHRLVDEPLECMAAIYDQLGMELTREARRRMQAWLETRSRATRKTAGHRYGFEQTGLDPEAERRRHRAAGPRYLAGLLGSALDLWLHGADRDRPALFTVYNNWKGWGLANPDGHYRRACLRGGAKYRVWGRRGTVSVIRAQSRHPELLEAGRDPRPRRTARSACAGPRSPLFLTRRHHARGTPARRSRTRARSPPRSARAEERSGRRGATVALPSGVRPQFLMPTDFIGLFAALLAARVRFVVVGGLAVLLHGVDRLTADVDLVIDLAPEAAREAVRALAAAGLRPALPVDPEQLADPDARSAWKRERGMEVFSFWDPANTRPAVDVFIEPPIPFEELWRDSKAVDLRGAMVHVASIDHLIRLKQLAGRAQDLADIERLRGLMSRSGKP